MPFRMQPMPFPIPALFNIAVKDICAINTFEKLFHILLSEVYCSHFGFTTLLLSETTTDMSLYEVLNLFSRWPLVFRSFLPAPLVARDVVTPPLRAFVSTFRRGRSKLLRCACPMYDRCALCSLLVLRSGLYSECPAGSSFNSSWRQNLIAKIIN